MEATNDIKRRARKRADGEGSLRWSESKKLWIGRVMVGYRPDGKPDVREVAAKQQGECRKRLVALKLQAANGTLIDAAKGRETVATFVTAWLDSIEGTMEPSSLTRHRDNVRRHIIPLIGRVKLTDLRPEHLVSLFAALRTERPAPKLPTDDAPRARHAAKKRPTTLPPLSARSVKYVYTTMRKALAQAVEWGNVPRNVATVVKSPKVPSPEILSLSPDEVATFLDAVTEAGDRLAPLYTVAVLSGCRLGELLGLKWSDISDADVISINRTLTSTKDGMPVFSDPKTQRSRRSFKLSSDAVAALSVLRDRQSFERQALKDGYRDFGLVFATPLGTPMDGPNALKRFRASLKAAGVTHPYTFHSLRHTAATTMLAAGIDAKVVADRLGHSSPAFTLERYAHAVPALDDDAADRLQNVIRRARKQMV